METLYGFVITFIGIILFLMLCYGLSYLHPSQIGGTYIDKIWVGISVLKYVVIYVLIAIVGVSLILIVSKGVGMLIL